MDSLVPVPVEEWPKLRDSFIKYKPYGIVGYNHLNSQINMQAMSSDFSLHVYSPYGDISNGMITKFNDGNLHNVVLYAISEETKKLEDAIVTTKLIDWHQGAILVLPGLWLQKPSFELATRMEEFLEEVLPRQGLQAAKEMSVHTVVFSRFGRPYDNVECPNGAYVTSVKLENVQQVGKTWSFWYDSPEWLLTAMIETGQSYGLYSSDEDSLMAWTFMNEGGRFIHLYCEEQHRRKGYADFLIKYATNERIKFGLDSCAYVVEENVKSLSLFTKLGYENIGKSRLVLIKKVT